MGISQSEQNDENKTSINIDIDELKQKEIKEGSKHELHQIKQFKIDQNKVVAGYVRQYKLRYKLLFAHDLLKLIECFYGSNCYEFYGSGILNKYVENTDDTKFNTSEFVKLARFSNLCIDIDQFQHRGNHIMIMTATNNILSIHKDIIYQHPFKTDHAEVIINKDSYFRSFIYCIKQKLFYGVGHNSYVSFWENAQNSSLILFHGLSKMFQNLHLNIKHIVCGFGHSLFLTENGEIYSFGRNERNQCGHDNQDRIEIPKKVSISSNTEIIAIDAGSLHSVCLDNENNLWCFGSNRWGQAGIGNFQRSIGPTKNEFYKNINIQEIICGNRTSMIIDNKGRCYMSGENTNNAYGAYGQCGDEIEENLCIPNIIQSLFVKQASNSYNHTLLLTLDNKVYAMGNNRFLQCSPFSKDVSNFTKPYHLSKGEMGIDDNVIIEKVIAINDGSIIAHKY